MKSISKFIALVLLLLMPLQVFAASNLSVCKSIKHTTATERAYAEMPCHEQMSSTSEEMENQKKSFHDIACDSYCAAMCASLSVISILHNHLSLIEYSGSSSVISMPYQSYTSVIQSNLLRPPIHLI